MHLTFRNVDDAFANLVRALSGRRFSAEGAGAGGDFVVPPGVLARRPSRNGDVLVVDEPVTITYTHPRERVLLNPARDWNPFLFLYHALFVLAGRNDVAPLAYYARRFREYSDDGETLNGSYGYRWRRWQAVSAVNGADPSERPDWHREMIPDSVDQLDILVEHLKGNPTSRRAVLQMWQVGGDLLKVDSSRDVCCNLSVLFSLRSVVSDGAEPPDPGWKVTETFLDMTVFNRSNDLIWGTLGEDYLTFTVLQEYVAARLGAGVGRYHQVSNNLHAYVGGAGATAAWRPDEWLAADGPRLPVGYAPTPLVRDPARFEDELPRFVANFDGSGACGAGRWGEPFLDAVARPLMRAFREHKEGRRGAALAEAATVADDGWRAAAERWLGRRADKRSPAG